MANVDHVGLAGIFEFREDRALVLAGLHGDQYAEANRRPGDSGLRMSARWAFAAAGGPPLRLSVVSLLSDPSSALMCSWAGEISTVVSGDPPAPRILGEREEVGKLGLAGMLAPSPLCALIPEPWPHNFNVDGSLVAADPLKVPDLQCKGAERYIASYDAAADVITSWTAEIRGRPAVVRKITHLIASK